MHVGPSTEALREFALVWSETLSQIFILNMEVAGKSSFVEAHDWVTRAYKEMETFVSPKTIEKSAKAILVWITQEDVVRPDNLHYCLILLSQATGYLINHTAIIVDVALINRFRIQRTQAATDDAFGILSEKDIQDLAAAAKEIITRI